MSESADDLAASPAPGESRYVRGEDRERVELCRKLLASRVSESDIERALAGKFGIGRRAARRCVALARQRMLNAAGRSREVHVADAYAFYCSLIANAEAKDADRIKAQERIEKLFGLERASQSETTEVDGEPLTLSWMLLNLDHSTSAPTGEPPNVRKGDLEYDRRTAQGET